MKMNQLLKLIIVSLTFMGVGLARSKTPTPRQNCVPPPSGLVAWWPGDGNTLDYQGDNNGTLQNGATFAPGLVAQAFSFDGVNQYVDVGGSLAINGSRTITAWIFVNANTGLGLPVMTGGATGAGDLFGVAGTTGVCGVGQYELYIDHWGSPCYDSNLAVIPNAWNHVAMTYDGTTINFYVNGVAGTPVSGSLYNYSINTYDIGGNNIGGTSTKASFNGLLDEVQLFNRALTQSEIQAIFNAGSAGECKPSLVIRPTELPDGIVSSPYNQTITAGSGTMPYTFTVSQGSLPSGLSLSNGGTISGTPQATGSSNFTVQVTDANNTTAQRAYSITIVPGCITPPPNIVGWYPGDGNAVDIQSGNNGSLQGGATFAPGKVGQAFSLNGSSAYVQAPAVAAQDPTEEGSLDAWVYLNQTGRDMSIIVKGGAGTDFNLQVFNRDGLDRFYFQVGPGGGSSLPSTTIVQAGQWYHVAGTWDATGSKIYVNGQLENTNGINHRNQSGQPFTIGADPIFGPRFFSGLIDEAQVFDRALTQAEVQAIYSAGIAGQCKTPSPNFCGVIAGQITDAQGPLQGALVQACEPNNGPCSFNATTDASGNYQITGLPLNTPFDLTVFPPQGSVDVPGQLLDRSASSCGTPLANQDVMLQAPAPPPPGTDIQPHRDGGGDVPVVYWHDPLTLTTSGNPNGTASYIISSGFTIFSSGPMPESPGGSGIYVATVAPLYPAHGAVTVVITVEYPGGGGTTFGFDLYIDPSGIVQDSHGAPISGATVTLLRSDTASGPFTVVPDGSAVMSPGNRHNPDMTDAQGHFGWDVLSGYYKVRAQHAGCNGIVETGVLQIPPPVTDLVLTLECPTELLSAVSRKTHGDAGDFDVALPLTGNPGVECRSGGAQDDHTLVITYSNDVVSGDATVTSGTGTVSGNPTFSANTMTVNLTGVANAQKITVTLSNVTDTFGQVLADIAVNANMLIGDTSGNRAVNASDVTQTKAQIGVPVTNANFREDVTHNGTINGSDVGLVKLHLGSGVP